MIKLHENFMVDRKGHRVGVVLGMPEYEKVLRELEELEDIRAFDEAKASGEKAIPFEKAISEIEHKRK